MNKIIARIAVAALLGFAHSALAQDCQVIDQFPYRITNPGAYCLDRSHIVDLDANEAAIEINAIHVSLDLRGHTLSAPTAGRDCDVDRIESGTAGVRLVNARNVRVTGGALDCFGFGIQLETGSSCPSCSARNRIEAMTISRSRFAGISGPLENGIVRGNQVVETGSPVDEAQFGIDLWGDGTTIIDNDVQTVWNGIGIRTESAHGLVVENRVQDATTGFLLQNDSELRYRDNVTTAVRSPYLGIATDLGNND